MSDIFLAPAWKISGIFRATECPNFLPHGTPTRIYSHWALPTCGARRSDRKWSPKWPPGASDRKWPPKWPQVTAQVTARAMWPQVTAAVTAESKWPQVTAQVTASDRQRQVTASDRRSDRKWPQVTAGSKWPQVTASDRFSQINFYCICTLSGTFAFCTPTNTQAFCIIFHQILTSISWGGMAPLVWRASNGVKGVTSHELLSGGVFFFGFGFQESYGWNSPWDLFLKVIHLLMIFSGSVNEGTKWATGAVIAVECLCHP